MKNLIRREFDAFFELKQTERLWHIPVLASLCVGIPLLIGYYLNRLDYGILACIGGLVILYLPTSTTIAQRMITLIACSFGFMVSFTIGVGFSFNPLLSSLVLGLFAFSIHWISNYFTMKPPGNFFFIMIASIASCMPFDLMLIPARVGVLGMGTMFACVLAFIYSLLIIKKYPPKTQVIIMRKGKFSSIVESAIIGVAIMISLLVSRLLELENPYWVPISCAAVMQGNSTRLVWERSFHRITGTFIGLGFAWLLLLLNITPFGICISILVLQFIIEMLVVRHYALAVIFITPMTMFLAEAGSATMVNPNVLTFTRLQDIVLGSLIGATGGWFLHHQQLRVKAERQIRKTRVALLRR